MIKIGQVREMKHFVSVFSIFECEARKTDISTHGIAWERRTRTNNLDFNRLASFALVRLSRCCPIERRGRWIRFGVATRSRLQLDVAPLGRMPRWRDTRCADQHDIHAELETGCMALQRCLNDRRWPQRIRTRRTRCPVLRVPTVRMGYPSSGGGTGWCLPPFA